MITFEKLERERIPEMSKMAKEIVKEHFDPLIGPEQNDYMIARFQTEEAIKEQVEHGYQYFFVKKEDRIIGFLAFYLKENVLYLSKFYLYKNQRGNGYSRKMLQFIETACQKAGLEAIELNVNRHNSACLAYAALGFFIAREEKNDIGHGFYMDDYVYRKEMAATIRMKQ